MRLTHVHLPVARSVLTLQLIRAPKGAKRWYIQSSVMWPGRCPTYLQVHYGSTGLKH